MPNVKLRGFSQSWIFNMRVSERLESLVFIQKHFFPRTQQLPRGNFSSQVFIYKYNFDYENLKCPLSLHMLQKIQLFMCTECISFLHVPPVGVS